MPKPLGARHGAFASRRPGRRPRTSIRLDDAVRLLREAGHGDRADRVEREILGRDVIPGHWTFRIVEEYNATYYDVFRTVEQEIRGQLAEGRDHLYEAGTKEARRTRGHPDHTAT
ncbi:hypothetical protein ACFU67_18760 [Streptomyces rhizosphaericola]|uniref:hypothetical protein n=1 Tax=Streptomyces rhizosphaericola TaxID=2564098 RepID=UPI00369024C8